MNQTPAGWYPDPGTAGQLRYWDGNQWTPQTQAASTPSQPQANQPPHPGPAQPGERMPDGTPVGPQTPGPAYQNFAGGPGGPRRKKPWWQRWWAIALGAFVALIVIVVAVSSGSGDKSSSDGKSTANEPTTSTTAKKEKSSADTGGGNSCGTNATADCTPRVGSNGQVRVDALYWRVTGAETAKSIGDPSIGLDQKASGTYLIVKLRVRSDKNESATLTPNVIQLDAGGTTYDPDNDGTVAAIGQGEEPLFLKDIGPDSNVQSEVVFDVPDKVLNKTLYVRFNELGFGPGHGLIKLPAPTPR